MIYDCTDALPYERILSIDFEFYGADGENPTVVCLVVKDIKSGLTQRYWQTELLRMREAPFDIGSNTLVLAYFASAEMQCFKTLKWEMPQNLIDPFAEFRRLTNGAEPPYGNGLVGALKYFGLDHFVPDAKEKMRALILEGGPWTDFEQENILDYCEEDVVGQEALFEALLEHEKWSFNLLGQALMRGRFMCAIATMQYNGIPIDQNTLSRLKDDWPNLKAKLIEGVDVDFGVFEGGSFKEASFDNFLFEHNIAWPRLESGRLKLDSDTFKDMSRRDPRVRPLRELRATLSDLKLNKLAVGSDGRNRTLLSPFKSKTGRNQPATSRYIFGPSKWIRVLIKPTKGSALAYLDWGSQEIAIAAALSGDELLWDAYASGDPYISFAIQAGLAPLGATKNSHKVIRDRCKQVVLGVNYGMSAHGVAIAAGIHVIEAQDLLQKHRETYVKFWAWADQNKERGLLGLPLETCFGWRIQATVGKVKANSFLNFPMQSHGAEMLRIASCLAIQHGLKLCAPIHDALLIEAPISQIDADVAQLKHCMSEASEAVLGDGKICKVDEEIVRFPDRYMDEHGQEMWDQIMGLLAQT